MPNLDEDQKLIHHIKELKDKNAEKKLLADLITILSQVHEDLRKIKKTLGIL